ncbi:succinate dehydrogenase [Salinisphaera hydrothermalis]|uniref:Succinate dehydrogenase n=1 Tax=Salinisphaera hydrothermalis (strain C41B8) TaxID=1304275 RepID=A0A084IPN6_SALHC|nr:succinate dehydrogenase [Salinisphaera hydrothermalis]KEZ78670.1 hypothetical protein C41B8_03606 [Salinisphaera hydrothermalis C41B8]
MNRANEVRLWAVMRLTSMVLAFAVLVHLITMIVVIRNGLSAEEILARTRGSVAWLVFYSVFVVVAAIHGSIGLRNIVREHTAWRGNSLTIAAAVFCVLSLWLGLRAVQGLFA